MSSRTTNNSKFRDKLFLSPQHFFLSELMKDGRIPISEIIRRGQYDASDRGGTHIKIQGQLSQMIKLGLVKREQEYDESQNRYIYNYELAGGAEEVISDTKEWYRPYSGSIADRIVRSGDIEVESTTSSSIFRGILFLSPHQFMITELISYFESLSVSDLVELGNYSTENRNTNVRIEEQLKRLEDLTVIEIEEGKYRLTDYGKAVLNETINWFEGNIENSTSSKNRSSQPEDNYAENRQDA